MPAKVVRTTVAPEVGISWSDRLHYVAPDTEVKRHPGTGEHATALCGWSVLVSSDPETKFAMQGWANRHRTLVQVGQGLKVRSPMCRRCDTFARGRFPAVVDLPTTPTPEETP